MVIFLPRPPILSKLLQYPHRSSLGGSPPGSEGYAFDFYLNVIKMGYFMEEARFERANYIEI